MNRDQFWRMHDWFWRIYDWASRIGILGVVVSAVGAAAIGLMGILDGQPAPIILLEFLGGFAALAVIYMGFCSLWDRFDPCRLKYLNYRDCPLSEAIRFMVRQSAWGRWYAARHLVNSGQPIKQLDFLNVASHIVTDKIVDGEIQVRGRLPGSMDYELIPQTHWRSSVLHFVPDPVSLERLIVIPRGGAEIDSNGNVIARDPVAAQRNSNITRYDSLLVDGVQFENIWPKRDPVADKHRRRLLREARRKKVNRDEIGRLS